MALLAASAPRPGTADRSVALRKLP